MYDAIAFNGRMLGYGDPIRVRHGQRILFRLLNASATEPIRLALPGHHFNIVALDGNPLPVAKTVDVIDLASAERADAIVEMNNPGVWILGAVQDDDREKGLGIVVETPISAESHAGASRRASGTTPHSVPTALRRLRMKRSCSILRKSQADAGVTIAGTSTAGLSRTPIG